MTDRSGTERAPLGERQASGTLLHGIVFGVCSAVMALWWGVQFFIVWNGANLMGQSHPGGPAAYRWYFAPPVIGAGLVVVSVMMAKKRRRLFPLVASAALALVSLPFFGSFLFGYMLHSI